MESRDGIFFSPEDLESLEFWIHLCFFWPRSLSAGTIFPAIYKKKNAQAQAQHLDV